jgi:hypothetical protein
MEPIMEMRDWLGIQSAWYCDIIDKPSLIEFIRLSETLLLQISYLLRKTEVIFLFIFSSSRIYSFYPLQRGPITTHGRECWYKEVYRLGVLGFWFSKCCFSKNKAEREEK